MSRIEAAPSRSNRLRTSTVPLCMGCVLAGGESSMIAVLEEYGKSVGIAFQIQDDYCSSPASRRQRARYLRHTSGHYCRALGFRDAGAKRSMTLDDFQGLIKRYPGVSQSCVCCKRQRIRLQARSAQCQLRHVEDLALNLGTFDRGHRRSRLDHAAATAHLGDDIAPLTRTPL